MRHNHQRLLDPSTRTNNNMHNLRCSDSLLYSHCPCNWFLTIESNPLGIVLALA
uniref:Uncharacterized protein n=1 Tax=Rhizophora mucronata TaxID=61149 RepID=A0A2P2L604_RHIMU